MRKPLSIVSNNTLLTADAKEITLTKAGEPLAPMSALHHGATSSIEAFSPIDGKKYVIAHTYSVHGIRADVVADLVVQMLSKGKQNKELVNEMIHALDMCLESGGLTWEAEQEADAIAMKARQMGFRP